MVNAQALIVVPLSNKQEDFRGARKGRGFGLWKKRSSRGTWLQARGKSIINFSFISTTVYVYLLILVNNCVRTSGKGRVFGLWKKRSSRGTWLQARGKSIINFSFISTTVYVYLLILVYNCVRTSGKQ